MTNTFSLSRILVVALGLVASSAPSLAQSLIVGVSSETQSIDPHFSIVNSSVSLTRHVFDPLVRQDERQRLLPGLAISWRPVSETEWEFRLRPNVHFHDGQPLSADDVQYSLQRAATLPNAPAGFAGMTRQISGISVVDPMTIRLQTEYPFPLMAEHLASVGIVSRRVAEGAETKDFNSGRAAIGTGPFRFVSWTPGDRVRLTRNDVWWDHPAAWREVSIMPIVDGAARVAALLSGTVDVIDQVPPNVRAVLAARSDITLRETASNRVVFLQFNHTPGSSPFIKDAAGTELAANPLTDRRVRQAISKAINRSLIVERIMEGSVTPAAQLLPSGHSGVSEHLRPEPYDPAGASALLAEAGYPRGFALTMQFSTGPNPADQPVAEAIAQMLTRVRITSTVEALPYSVFQTRQQKRNYAVALRSWGTETGEVSMAIRTMFATRDAAPGWGAYNRSNYSNSELDITLRTALTAFDPDQRAERLQRVSEVLAADVAMVPLYFQMASWAMRANLTYTPRSDVYTYAWEIRPETRR